MEALVAASGRFFACFHKRYAPYNKFARKDLGVSEGDPISYFALAQEIPVPKWHWYNWPNSGTRLLSNGCHWIDHFMFLNGYRKVIKRETTLTRIGDVHVLLELENGAVFNMLLTDYGSPRLGVRDYVELRSATPQSKSKTAVDINRRRGTPWYAERVSANWRLRPDVPRDRPSNRHRSAGRFTRFSVQLTHRSRAGRRSVFATSVRRWEYRSTGSECDAVKRTAIYNVRSSTGMPRRRYPSPGRHRGHSEPASPRSTIFVPTGSPSVFHLPLFAECRISGPRQSPGGGCRRPDSQETKLQH